MKFLKQDLNMIEKPFVCSYCKSRFTKQKTVTAHMCEKKRRISQKNEKRVQAGYMVFIRFFNLTQHVKKERSYEEFCDSSYYNAFVKFGSYINNIKPLYPEKFIDYVITSGVKLDHWCRDELYEKYLIEILKSESAEDATQRSLQTMIDWADENKAQFEHYFDFVNSNRAVHDIINGKISCWVILNCNSGKRMLERMNDEQLSMINHVVDVKFWITRFKILPADALMVKEICKEVKIK